MRIVRRKFFQNIRIQFFKRRKRFARPTGGLDGQVVHSNNSEMFAAEPRPGGTYALPHFRCCIFRSLPPWIPRMRTRPAAWIASFLLAFGFSAVGVGEQPVPTDQSVPGQLVDAPQKSQDEHSRPAADTKANKPLSPLHTFLGIDPTTDSFTRPDAKKKAARAAKKRDNQSSADASIQQSSPEGGKGGKARSLDDPEMAAVENAQEVREAIANALQNGDQNSLLAALPGLSQGAKYEQVLEMTRRYSLLLYLLMFAYPAYMVTAEMVQWLIRKFDPALSDVDRRYFRSRMRRRLLLTATSASTIALLCWGSAAGFWLGQPGRLAGFATALFTLFIASVILRQLIRSAAAQYPVKVMRELHVQQLKLQADVDELRKRLHSMRLAGGIS